MYLLNNYRGGHIFSSGYNGEDKKTIARGSLNVFVLGVFGDSLYYQNTNRYHIKEMNVSSGNISRTILLDNVFYYGMIVVDKSVQPIGELE
jgi:hypothetical protein